MIKLFDIAGDELRLLKTRAVDDGHYATRKSIRAAIDSAIDRGVEWQFDDQGEPTTRLTIRSAHPNNTGITLILVVGVTYRRGIVRLGCHTFNRENSKHLLRWANA